VVRRLHENSTYTRNASKLQQACRHDDLTCRIFVVLTGVAFFSAPTAPPPCKGPFFLERRLASLVALTRERVNRQSHEPPIHRCPMLNFLGPSTPMSSQRGESGVVSPAPSPPEDGTPWCHNPVIAIAQHAAYEDFLFHVGQAAIAIGG
jgi:hypothetical protein